MKFYSGFTLMEMLIVIVIMVILSSLSIPSYTQYVALSHRQTAEQILSRLSIALEEYELTNGTYRDVSLEKLGLDEIHSNYYHFEMVNATDTTYTLEAVPIGLQAARDSACGSLVLNSQGEKSDTGVISAADCW